MCGAVWPGPASLQLVLSTWHLEGTECGGSSCSYFHLNEDVPPEPSCQDKQSGSECHGSRHLKPEGTVGVWALLRPRGLCSCEALGAFPQLPPQAVSEDSAGCVRTLRVGVR